MKKLLLIVFLLIFIQCNSQNPIDSLTNKFINHWIGKPYKFGGTSEKGIDCSALTQKFYKTIFNFDIPRTCVYQFKKCMKITLDEIKVGDLIFFRSSLSPSKWHCGIYIGNNKFFHSANRKEGVKINDLTDNNYLNSIKGIGRFN